MKKVLAVILILCGIACLWLTYGHGISEATEQYAKYMLQSNASALLYKALFDRMSEIDISSLVTQRKSGDITVLTVDADAVNRALMLLSAKANEVLSKKDVCDVRIPLGSLTGIRLLSGKGPDITIKTVPVGNAVGDIKSDIVSVGINQSKHRITVCIRACVAMLYPFESCMSDICVDILLCETVIVGSVPEVVFG